MAIIDDRSELAYALALSTGGTGRQLVGDVIDTHGPTTFPNQSIPAPDGSFLNITVSTTFTSGGPATVAFELVSDAQSAIATDGTATVHAVSASIPVAGLTQGRTVFSIAMPQSPMAERYLGVLANVSTAGLTAGKVNVWISAEPVPQPFSLYADNVR